MRSIASSSVLALVEALDGVGAQHDGRVAPLPGADDDGLAVAVQEAGDDAAP